MDDERFDELSAKRDRDGLTDEEADELGRLTAEREGRPYSNADARPDAEPSSPAAAPGEAEPIESSPGE